MTNADAPMVSRSTKIFFVCWILMMGWVTSNFLYNDPERDWVGVQALRAHLQEMNRYPGATPVGDMDSLPQIHRSIISQSYSVDDSFSDVLSFHVAALPSQGWVLRRRTARGAGFCRGTVYLGIGKVKESRKAPSTVSASAGTRTRIRPPTAA